jgi:hypothetical protein
MLSFLLWTSQTGDTHEQLSAVARAFGDLFAPFLPSDLHVHTRSFKDTCLVWFELPVQGWRPPYFQEDSQTAVWAADFPLNGHTVLQNHGTAADSIAFLPPLARAIQAHPKRILEQLVPPMLLLWEDKAAGELHLLNDALGHAQLYRYSSNGKFALSNRLFAFKALCAPLTARADEWAANCSFGWFPLNRTGFKEVRFVDPATHYTWNAAGTPQQQSLNVLDSWIKPPAASRPECMEMARMALLNYITATWPLFSDASGGLTGGYDSRSIFATYRYLGLKLRARVKGPANNYDVILSKRLAAMAGMDLTVKPKAELPPIAAESIRASVHAALVWQAGNMDNEKMISFLPAGSRLPVGSVNVMGRDGPIGRGFFARLIGADKLDPQLYQQHMVRWLTEKIPDFFLPEIKAGVQELIHRMVQQGVERGLSDAKQLDFLYLFERVRRWSSGSQHSQTSQVLAPFLNGQFIRAAFSYTDSDLQENVFHRYIIDQHAPDWIQVPFDKELKKLDKQARRRSRDREPPGSWTRSNNNTYYNRRLFWQQAGASLLEEGLAGGHFWRTIVDAAKIKEQTFTAGDELMMLCELETLL